MVNSRKSKRPPHLVFISSPHLQTPPSPFGSDVYGTKADSGGWVKIMGAMMSECGFVGLVVEDEWLLRLELTEELSGAGWQILEAASGEEAQEQISAAAHIDFLVTDIRLAGKMDGWAVADMVRRTYPQAAVIYVSANPRNRERQVTDSVFLGKPVDIRQLLTARDRLVRMPGA
jgi:CheY-like chemotaxis protein